jgi:hypothetical protein
MSLEPVGDGRRKREFSLCIPVGLQEFCNMPWNLTTGDLLALLPIWEKGVLQIFIALKSITLAEHKSKSLWILLFTNIRTLETLWSPDYFDVVGICTNGHYVQKHHYIILRLQHGKTNWRMRVIKAIQPLYISHVYYLGRTHARAHKKNTQGHLNSFPPPNIFS